LSGKLFYTVNIVAVGGAQQENLLDIHALLQGFQHWLSAHQQG
jgi:hypothetical protein